VITAVDTNVLLDVFGGDPEYGPRSGHLVRTAIAEGKVLACGPVWAETLAFFRSAVAGREAMNRLGVEFSPVEMEAVLAAADAWRSYRRRGGTRDRIVADFLIGAHALHQADRLLTRDRGFYRRCFSRLRLLDPSTR